MAGKKGATKIMHGVKYSADPVHSGWKRLKVGKTYKFTPITIQGRQKKVADDVLSANKAFKAKVIGEHAKYYLIQRKNYVTTLHKNAIGVDWRCE